MSEEFYAEREYIHHSSSNEPLFVAMNEYHAQECVAALNASLVDGEEWTEASKARCGYASYYVPCKAEFPDDSVTEEMLEAEGTDGWMDHEWCSAIRHHTNSGPFSWIARLPDSGPDAFEHPTYDLDYLADAMNIYSCHAR